MGKQKNKKRKIIFLLGGIVIFFSILFVYYLAKLGIFSEEKTEPQVRNNLVVFAQPKLAIFDTTRYINEFPDTVRMHYPYMLVIVPEDKKKITTVYSLDAKKEVAALHDIALDYGNGKFLYNYHGGETRYAEKALGVSCTQGFIKNEREILCIMAKGNDPLENKLISIDPQTLEKKEIYSSANLLSTVSVIDGKLYIGEQNIETEKYYLVVGQQIMESSTPIDLIYPMQGKVYFATFKTVATKRAAAFYEVIMQQGKQKLSPVEKGRIVLYQQN